MEREAWIDTALMGGEGAEWPALKPSGCWFKWVKGNETSHLAQTSAPFEKIIKELSSSL